MGTLMGRGQLADEQPHRTNGTACISGLPKARPRIRHRGRCRARRRRAAVAWPKTTWGRCRHCDQSIYEQPTSAPGHHSAAISRTAWPKFATCGLHGRRLGDDKVKGIVARRAEEAFAQRQVSAKARDYTVQWATGV